MEIGWEVNILSLKAHLNREFLHDKASTADANSPYTEVKMSLF